MAWNSSPTGPELVSRTHTSFFPGNTQLRVNRATSRLSPRSRVFGGSWTELGCQAMYAKYDKEKKWAGQGLELVHSVLPYSSMNSIVSKYSELYRLWRRYICQRRMIECIHSTVDSFSHNLKFQTFGTWASILFPCQGLTSVSGWPSQEIC